MSFLGICLGKIISHMCYDSHWTCVRYLQKGWSAEKLHSHRGASTKHSKAGLQHLIHHKNKTKTPVTEQKGALGGRESASKSLSIWDSENPSMWIDPIYVTQKQRKNDHELMHSSKANAALFRKKCSSFSRQSAVWWYLFCVNYQFTYVHHLLVHKIFEKNLLISHACRSSLPTEFTQ